MLKILDILVHLVHTLAPTNTHTPVPFSQTQKNARNTHTHTYIYTYVIIYLHFLTRVNKYIYTLKSKCKKIWCKKLILFPCSLSAVLTAICVYTHICLDICGLHSSADSFI